jgi:hypothetical protein
LRPERLRFTEADGATVFPVSAAWKKVCGPPMTTGTPRRRNSSAIS